MDDHHLQLQWPQQPHGLSGARHRLSASARWFGCQAICDPVMLSVTSPGPVTRYTVCQSTLLQLIVGDAVAASATTSRFANLLLSNSLSTDSAK